MDASWFDALPVLCKNRKHSVEEIHVLLCPSPRPVAVKIGAGYRKLPEDMWPMGELAARALQGVEIYEMEACLIGGFLAQILCQALPRFCAKPLERQAFWKQALAWMAVRC